MSTFPKVIPFADYHEIDAALSVLKHFFSEIQAEEINTDQSEGLHWGLFWLHEKPFEAEIEEMIAKYLQENMTAYGWRRR